MRKCLVWLVLLSLSVPLGLTAAETDEAVAASTPPPTPPPDETTEASVTPPPEVAEEVGDTPTPDETGKTRDTPVPDATETAGEEETPEAKAVLTDSEIEKDNIGTASEPEVTDEAESEAAEEEDETEEEEAEEEETIQSGLQIAQRRNVSWRGVDISSEEGMAIPKLYQTDYCETVCIYNGTPRSVATSGCGAACLSMVIAYLTGDRTQNPYSLFREAVCQGWYAGDGLSKSVLSHLAQMYSVSTQWICNDADRIIAELKAGHPIIAHMGIGNFSGSGHYIVLRGVTENGKILVNDPNSRSNSGMAFPISLLIRQARTDNAFMVCRAAG